MTSPEATALAQKPPRISLIDALRGIALVAMTIYHFVWDLEFFHWVLPLTVNETGWVIFARCIASSFLFLVGISLVLAHENGVRWRSFGVRFAQVASAAALISLVTYFAFPNGFIFFGILHAIALFSVLGLIFIHAPWWVCGLFAVVVFGVEYTVANEIFMQKPLLWVGLAPQDPASNDYVPLFPWFAATLLGMTVAKLALRLDWVDRLAAISLPTKLEAPLTFMGRHSLIYYLVHQPILLALVWSFTQVAGPADRTAGFVKLCTQQCSILNDEKFCRPYCGCAAQGLKSVKIFNAFHRGEVRLASDPRAQRVINRCNKLQKLNPDGTLRPESNAPKQ